MKEVVDGVCGNGNVETLPIKYFYLEFTIDFDKRQGLPSITKPVIKAFFVLAIRKIFGEFGSAVPIDLMKYDETSFSGILRCPASFYVKLRSSLTLISSYENLDCRVNILRASPCLLALSSNSPINQAN